MPYYTIEGRELYYEIKGNGFPVMLLHGYLGDSKTHFGNQFNSSDLIENYTLIAPDYRGFGNSQLEEFKRWGEKHTSEQLLNDIEFLISELKYKEIFIGGYSVGAALALEYGKKHPDQVKGIILISPRPFTHKYGKSYPYLSKKSRSSSNFIKKFISNTTWGILKRYYKRKSLKDIERKAENKELIDSFKLLKEIPIFMVYANKDSVTPKLAFDVLIENIPHIEVNIFDGDHGVLHEQADKFNHVVKEFLDKTTREWYLVIV